MPSTFGAVSLLLVTATLSGCADGPRGLAFDEAAAIAYRHVSQTMDQPFLRSAWSFESVHRNCVSPDHEGNDCTTGYLVNGTPLPIHDETFLDGVSPAWAMEWTSVSEARILAVTSDGRILSESRVPGDWRRVVVLDASLHDATTQWKKLLANQTVPPDVHTVRHALNVGAEGALWRVSILSTSRPGHLLVSSPLAAKSVGALVPGAWDEFGIVQAHAAFTVSDATATWDIEPNHVTLTASVALTSAAPLGLGATDIRVVLAGPGGQILEHVVDAQDFRDGEAQADFAVDQPNGGTWRLAARTEPPGSAHLEVAWCADSIEPPGVSDTSPCAGASTQAGRTLR